MEAFILIAILLFSGIGCSTSHIMRDCQRVEGDEVKHVCKNIKPWE